MTVDEKDSSLEELFLGTKRAQEADALDVTSLSISSLSHLCRESTDRYFQQASHDDRICLELFRRAIEDQDQEAWHAIIDQYSDLVRYWVRSHNSFDSTDEDQDYFLNRAFDNFWRAFSRDPRKITRFSDIKSILQYLKLCAFTTVQEYVERQMRPRTLYLSNKPIEAIAVTSDPIGGLHDRMLADAIWDHVVSSLKNDQERIVATQFFLYDVKPRHIYAEHKDTFSSIDQVRRVKGNLMARLRRDKRLIALMEGFD